MDNDSFGGMSEEEFFLGYDAMIDEDDPDSINYDAREHRGGYNYIYASGGGCRCIAILPILLVVVIICFIRISFTSFAFNIIGSYDPVEEAYRGGEPDYADGDLEDKLGDSGYYYDLFPEERDGEPDDYKGGYTSRNYNGNNMIVDHITNFNSNKKAYKSEILPAGDLGDVIVVGNNIYFRYKNGTFYKGWLGLPQGWYYFDPITFAVARNEFKNINGVVYYFGDQALMLSNTIIEVAGHKVYIDINGSCTLVS